MALPDPKQLRILKALCVHLMGIKPSNGYDVDLSGADPGGFPTNVFRGQAKFGSDQPTPFVSVLESLRPDPRPKPSGLGKVHRIDDWELLVQGWVDESRQYPTDDLYKLKAQVEKRLAEVQFPGQSVYRLGGLINDLQIGPGVVRAATPQVGGAESFYLPLIVTYVINVADPFA